MKWVVLSAVVAVMITLAVYFGGVALGFGSDAAVVVTFAVDFVFAVTIAVVAVDTFPITAFPITAFLFAVAATSVAFSGVALGVVGDTSLHFGIFVFFIAIDFIVFVFVVGVTVSITKENGVSYRKALTVYFLEAAVIFATICFHLQG